MGNEIVKHEPVSIIRTIDDAERAAKAMAASGFFSDTRQAGQALVKILAGQELGFGPFASMTGVNIIQNKPVLAANLMAAAVKRGGKYNYRIPVLTEKECEVEFFEAGQPVGKSKFTMDDAAKAGLTTKDNWKKYTKNMLFARAISNGVRWFAPDIFNGATVYTPDELGAAVDDDGNAIVEAGVVENLAIAPEEFPGMNQDVVEIVDPIDPLATASVKWASEQWKIGTEKTREQIKASSNFTAPMAKAEFKRLVLGQPETT